MFVLIVLSVCVKSVLLQPRSSSAIPDSSLQSKIMGGTRAEIFDFPHQVFYVRQEGNNTESVCGGSIYKDNVIITAAHCLVDVASLKNIIVFAGLEYYLDWMSSTNGHSVQKLIIHEDYGKDREYENDIALMILENGLKFRSNVKPIALPEHDEVIKAGVIAMVSGWGSICEHGPMSLALLYTNVRVISNEDCELAYGSGIADDSLCAGEPSGGHDSCQGDSGGPLIFNKKLIGIVSYGHGCGRKGFPGVYARVSHFRHWIDEHFASYLSEESGNMNGRRTKPTTVMNIRNQFLLTTPRMVP